MTLLRQHAGIPNVAQRSFIGASIDWSAPVQLYSRLIFAHSWQHLGHITQPRGEEHIVEN